MGRFRKHFTSLAIAAAAVLVAVVTYLLMYAKPPATTAAAHHEPTAATPATNLDTPPAAEPSKEPNSASSETSPRDHRTWMRELADALIRRGDPRSLGAAALLMNAYAAELSDPTEQRDAFRKRVVDLLHRAAEAAPNDVSVQSVALTFCRNSAFQAAGCDPQPYEEALATLDPPNAWAATGDLAHANTARDAARQAAALARIARAQRLDTHRIEIEALFASALESVRVAPADRADADSVPPAQRLTTTAVNAAPVDALDGISAACTLPLPENARGPCVRATQLMRDSTDPILADEGLRLATRLAVPNSKEEADLRQANRRYNWQMMLFLRLPRSPEQNVRFLRDRVPSNDLREEVLLQNGAPIEPPPDYEPLSP